MEDARRHTMHIIHNIGEVQQRMQRTPEAGGLAVHVVARREGQRKCDRSEKHLDADDEVLQAPCQVLVRVLVVRSPRRLRSQDPCPRKDRDDEALPVGLKP